MDQPPKTEEPFSTPRSWHMLSDAMTSFGDGISVHDFRMVAGPSHTNVIFDALVSRKIDRPDAEIRREISDLVSRMDGNYFAVVTIDRPYV